MNESFSILEASPSTPDPTESASSIAESSAVAAPELNLSLNSSADPVAGARSVARGTLANAALPGAAFHPDEFDVEVSQTSLAEADELLKSTLDEAMLAVGGNRAFLALVDTLSGELVLRFTAGEGWTEDIRRLRVNMQAGDKNGDQATQKRYDTAESDAAPNDTSQNDAAPNDTAPNDAAPNDAAQNNAAPGETDSSSTHVPPFPRSLHGRTGITRHVVVNGRRYWTGDVNRDPYYIGFFPDVVSEVAVPITARGGGTIGVVNIESSRPDAFGEEHANIISVLARRVAVIVAMAEHQLREEALISIGKDFSSTADSETVMQDVVVQATKILRADDCSLFLMHEDQARLQLAASHGPLGEQAGRREARYALGEGLTGWVAQNSRVIRVGDPRTDARWKGLFMEAPAGELAAVMAVPVRGHRGMIGVLRVVRHRKGSLYFLPQEFTQADEDVLVTLAGQLAVAIDRTRLLDRLLKAERMAAWGEMSARSAHMIGNAVFGVKGHLNELTHWINNGLPDAPTTSPGMSTHAATQDTKTSEMVALPAGEAKLLMENITRGIYRLEEILGEFRDFVLATQLLATPHDINHILRNVTAESFPRHSNIDLVLNLTPMLPSVLADEAKLKRAFSELIENSIDFQPHGGMLTILTSVAEPEAVRDLTGHAMPGPVIQIEFIDHGPGLSDQDRERVFTPFYTRKAKGMGLGLSIVKGIIEAHHGAIHEIGTRANARPGTSQSRVRGGAHFVILLPAQSALENGEITK